MVSPWSCPPPGSRYQSPSRSTLRVTSSLRSSMMMAFAAHRTCFTVLVLTDPLSPDNLARRAGASRVGRLSTTGLVRPGNAVVDVGQQREDPSPVLDDRL